MLCCLFVYGNGVGQKKNWSRVTRSSCTASSDQLQISSNLSIPVLVEQARWEHIQKSQNLVLVSYKSTLYEVHVLCTFLVFRQC
jgi:hypothetical protein